MHLERLPRRLRYTFPGGVETEYPTDIPTPIPEIKCEEVQVEQPPAVPATFIVWQGREPVFRNQSLGGIYSTTVPVISDRGGGFYSQGRYWWFPWIAYTNAQGQPLVYAPNTNALWWYFTPGNTIAPRRDLLVGTDRIVNPRVNTPCPTWRFTGGNCPPNSLDCGNCCLDCASVVAGIDGATALILPISTWRKK